MNYLRAEHERSRDDVSDLGLRPSTGNGLLKSGPQTPLAGGPSRGPVAPFHAAAIPRRAAATSDDRDGARRRDVTRPSVGGREERFRVDRRSGPRAATVSFPH